MAEISARLSLDSSRFSAGIERAKASLQEFDSAVSSFGLGIGGLLSVAGFAALSKSAIESGGHIFDMAERLGVANSTIQKFDYAAKQTGTDMETLARGVLKAQANIANGGIEAEKYQRALDMLGITTQELIGLNAEDFLIRVAKGFTDAKDRTQANAAVLSLFGSRLSAIIPLLAEGADGVRRIMDEAPIISDANINSLKTMEDQLTTLTAKFKVFTTEAVLGAANKLQQLAKTGAYVMEFLSRPFVDADVRAAALKQTLADIDGLTAPAKHTGVKTDPEAATEANESRRKTEVDKVAQAEARLYEMQDRAALEAMDKTQRRAELIQRIADMEFRINLEKQNYARMDEEGKLGALKNQEKLLEYQRELRAIKDDEVKIDEERSPRPRLPHSDQFSSIGLFSGGGGMVNAARQTADHTRQMVEMMRHGIKLQQQIVAVAA